jgi:hypothetical protein
MTVDDEVVTMERDIEGGRTLSQFGRTWGARQPPQMVGWYLWAVLAAFAAMFALAGWLQSSA